MQINIPQIIHEAKKRYLKPGLSKLTR